MNDLVSNLSLGFSVALTLQNLGLAFIGCLVGTLIGVLPGIGPTATIAMLLPITFALSPATSLIMLAGIYYGAQYGGSTTAILINLPGESSSAVTAIDGYQMARRGRAGPALATAALGSFFAGTVATILIALFAPPLTRMALQFGPAEYFSLMLLGLVTSIALAHGSVFKALAIGVFGIAEILRNLENETDRDVVIKKVTNLFPSRSDFKAIVMPVLRGTALGSILGILPGGGAILSSFAAYSVEKRLSRNPGKFGKGAIEGVAAPESANNAGAQTSFIPMLTLGIPANPVMAMMIGAMIIQGI